MAYSMNSADGALRILIVEDEALVAFELETHLSEAGYVVVGTADDLDSALEVADGSPADLALVDIQLATGTNGRDVARALKQRGIPSLFATGNCPGQEAEEAIGCLHKPFGSGQLLEAVSAAVALARGQQPRHIPSVMHVYRTA